MRPASVLLTGLLWGPCWFVVSAQEPTYVFRHLTTENGLASNNTASAMQDDKGFIWISTDNGLQRFDGKSFFTFKHDPGDSIGIRMDGGRCFLEDGDKRIWIGQWPYGFGRLDPETGHCAIVNTSKNPMAENSLSNCGDVAGDPSGNIWMSAYNQLAEFDIRAHRLVSFGKDIPAGVTFLGPIQYDPVLHACWLCGNRGVYLYDPAHHELIYRGHNPNHLPEFGLQDTVGVLYLDRERNIWASTYHKGFWRYGRASGHWERILGADLPVACITEDRNGIIWISVKRKGLLEYVPKTRKFEWIKRVDPGKEGLSYRDILYGIFQDREGDLWLTTDNGVFIFNPDRQKFHPTPFPPGRLDNKVSTLNCLEARNGDIWAATYGAGIYVFDSIMQVKHQYHRIPLDLSWCLLERPDGKIAIGGQHGWLSAFDPRSHGFTHDLPPELNRLTISNMVFDREKKNVWMALYHGIARWNWETNRFEHRGNFLPGPNSVPVVNDVVVDSQENVWVATEGAGLQKQVKGADAFSEMYIPDKLGSYVVQSLTVMDTEHLGVATFGGGIDIVDTRGRKVRQISTRDGLPGNNVSALYFIPPRSLWAATDQGICLVDLERNKIRRFGAPEGIPTNDFADAFHFLRLGNGDLVIGYRGGVLRFNPRDMPAPRPPKDVLLTGLRVFDTPLSLDSILDGQGVARFSHTQNFISIQYISPAFLQSDPIRYSYQLEGVDGDWVNAGERNIAYYTNLEAGNYTFKVRCEGRDGLVSPHVTFLRIHINPPFWQTWWFYLACVTLLGSLLYGAYLYRLREVLRVQSVRNKISRDLHDDLGATLSSISVLSDVVMSSLETGNDGEALPLVSKINVYSREMVDRMRDIVWAIGPTGESMGDLIQRLKNLGTEVAGPKGISIHFSLDDAFGKLSLPITTRKNIYLICKEALYNAVRHSGCTEIHLHFGMAAPNGQITVSDNGNGFDASVAQGNGLINMNYRAKEMGGTWEIHSSPGGTRVLIRFPVPRIRRMTL